MAVAPTWRLAVTGLCAYLIAVGLARFAYTPLIPALIQDNWFSPAQAAYLGAANLAGYLVGAILSRRIARLGSTATILRVSMLVIVVGFFACAGPAPFAWFFIWRTAAGFAGALLMVLTAPYLLPYVPPERRGLASGVLFVGPGSGIVIAGTLVPILLNSGGLPLAWIGIGVLSIVLTAIAWTGWPPEQPAAAPLPKPAGSLEDQAAASRLARTTFWLMGALYAVYTFSALGLIPHMLFLVDYVARGIGRGVSVGAFHWVLFGLGAMVGPLLAGVVGDRFGFRLTLRIALVVQAAGVGLLALSGRPSALVVSSLVIGAFIPAISVFILGRIRELIDGEAAANAWRIATIGFAVGQALGGYALSYIFAHTGEYKLLFALGTGAIVIAFAVDVAADLWGRRERRAALGGVI